MSSLSTELVFFLGGDDSDVAEAVVTVDHVRTGLSRLCLQFRSANPMDEPEQRTNMEKLLAVLLAQFNDLELALQQLIQLRGLPTATGIYLDEIGKLLDQPRGELVDEDYRRYLFARVATNKARGRRRNLIKVAKLILNDSSARIVITTSGPAAFLVQIESTLVPDALAAVLLDFLAAATAAGIRLGLLSSPDLLADQFALGTAAYATAGGYTAGQGTITVDDTSNFPVIGSLIVDEGTANEEEIDYAGTTATTFTLLSPLVNNHVIRTAVALVEPSTGKGLGDVTEAGENLVPYSDVGTNGGTFIDFRESAPS